MKKTVRKNRIIQRIKENKKFVQECLFDDFTILKIPMGCKRKI
jgi:hypothetical protein